VQELRTVYVSYNNRVQCFLIFVGTENLPTLENESLQLQVLYFVKLSLWRLTLALEKNK
jgi:hypothetical protein